MKKNIAQLMCIVAALILLAVTSTNTNSKYVTNKSINLTIKTGNEIYSYMPTTNAGLRETFTATQAGYYAILARGGDAGKTYQEGNGGTLISNIDGADGGCILGYYYLDANNKLTFCVSSSGTDSQFSKTTATNGVAGKNTLDRFLGADGKVGKENWATISPKDATAGSGGATVVYKGESILNTDILVIAGGGGASATYNSGYSSGLVTGVGGDAGSNFDLNLGSGSIGTVFSVDQPVNGTVFPGHDATLVAETKCGKGATNTYGAAGTSSDSGQNGKSFSDNSNAGNGGQGGGIAGSGGGGYAGGGGGASIGVYDSSGHAGGGGGSSFISGNVKTFSSSGAKRIVDAMLNAMKAKGETKYVLSTPLNNRYTTSSTPSSIHGYVIIMYLGTDESVITNL